MVREGEGKKETEREKEREREREKKDKEDHRELPKDRSHNGLKSAYKEIIRFADELHPHFLRNVHTVLPEWRTVSKIACIRLYVAPC